MMKLERLKIEKFRNVKPGSEIRFSNGFNLVLGRNGTGKTTLLDLVSRIVRWDFSDLDKVDFDIEYDLRTEDRLIGVKISNRRERDATADRGEISEFSNSEQSLRQQQMVARVTKDAKTTEIEYADGVLLVNGSQTQPPKINSLFSSGSLLLLVVLHSLGGLYSMVKRAIGAVRFDESLDLFRFTWESSNSPGIFVAGSGPLLPLVTSRPSMPPELLDSIGRKYGNEPKFTAVAIPDDQLAFLRTTTKLMQYENAELRLDLLTREVTSQGSVAIQLGNMIARFFFADGGFITQDRLSYGQKRLLMFYYYLASNPDIVIADELVNGLHHQWIRACIDEIGERQAFLTSQNPLLLDYLPFSSAEHVQKSFVLCTAELDENKKPVWTWSNMSEDASMEFYSAYQVGIEQVSEILQSQGLF